MILDISFIPFCGFVLYTVSQFQIPNAFILLSVTFIDKAQKIKKAEVNQ